MGYLLDLGGYEVATFFFKKKKYEGLVSKEEKEILFIYLCNTGYLPPP
jgi:hypothetical protein